MHAGGSFHSSGTGSGPQQFVLMNTAVVPQGASNSQLAAQQQPQQTQQQQPQQFVPAPAGGLFYVFVPTPQASQSQQGPNGNSLGGGSGPNAYQTLGSGADPATLQQLFAQSSLSQQQQPTLIPMMAAPGHQDHMQAGNGSGSILDIISSHGLVPSQYAALPGAPPPPMWGSQVAPPPPPPPMQHHQHHQHLSHSHSHSHSHGSSMGSMGSQMMASGSPSQKLIHRTGNVHDVLRTRGCLFVSYEGPVLEADQIATGQTLPAVSGQGIQVTSTPPTSPGNSLGGAIPQDVADAVSELTQPSSPDGCSPAPETTAPATTATSAPTASQVSGTAPSTQSAAAPSSQQQLHRCTFFVSSFPTEKMECAQQLLTRVLQTVCAGVVDLPEGPQFSPLPDAVSRLPPPMVTAISFLSASSRGSSHSFYAKVSTSVNPQILMKRLKGCVMMDRLGFHWAVTAQGHQFMEQYSKSIWNLPQSLRHRRTEWLPCTPLIFDIALDTSKVRWHSQPL